MRTPSLYSQDDPITIAMKPPSTETDEERAVRQAAESEAKKISEQIDEELREERERLKRRKGDVKVRCFKFIYLIVMRIYSPLSFTFYQLLLLGQAESGKSTLQKQFQLMYKPNSLDQERSSWKTVIYFNVVHTLKHILTTLEAWDDVLDDDDTLDDTTSISTKKLVRGGISDQPSPSASLISDAAMQSSPASLARSEASGSGSHSMSSKESGAQQIASLRRKLSPIVAAEEQLADRLSGGISVSGSGKGGVYVRSGWQARTIENALGKIKTKRPSTATDKKPRDSASQDIPPDPLVEEVGRMLEVSETDIRALWDHPTVRGMIAKRRLKLDEWSEL